jgi:hypothetical protein
VIRYNEYWPAFVDPGRESAVGEVETLDDLLEVAFIKERSVRGETAANFAVSSDGKRGHLMREFVKDEWWVVATLSSDTEITATDKIPLWVSPPQKVMYRVEKVRPAPVPLDDLIASGAVKQVKY